MMDEYIPGSMTDEQALKALKSAKFTMERGSAKSIFQYGLMEAMCRAIKALEEKVEYEKGQNDSEDKLRLIHDVIAEYIHNNDKTAVDSIEEIIDIFGDADWFLGKEDNNGTNKETT